MSILDASGDELFTEVADVIGADTAVALFEAFCGEQLYIPQHAGPDHPISKAIGEAKAALLGEYFHGVWVKIPVAPVKQWKVREMLRSGAKVGDICRSLLVSRSTVYRILSDDRKRLPRGPKEAGKAIPRSPA